MNHVDVGKWLLYCADPLGPRRPPPRHMLTPDLARDLVAQAAAHGVLPAIVRNFAPLSNDPGFAAATADARTRLRGARALVLMLGGECDALLDAAAGLPVTAVKGPVFARRIYPDRQLRTFSDIDLLASPAAVPQLSQLLVARGFELADGSAADLRQEWQWVHRDNSMLMVEVHTDLVHAASLRRGLSLSFDDLAGETDTPAGCLLVALVHGAFSHAYGRIQHIVDICQAGRAIVTADDEHRFERLVQRTGARYAAAAGLDLAGRILAEPRCLGLARAFGAGPRARLAGLLVGHSFVVPDTARFRTLNSWRRKALREVLKRSSH